MIFYLTLTPLIRGVGAVLQLREWKSRAGDGAQLVACLHEALALIPNTGTAYVVRGGTFLREAEAGASKGSVILSHLGKSRPAGTRK